ncbi:MAG: protein translocase subunit SecF [Candidatus Peregrinibacteria bacterium]|nr:protein translocase subunit SecF [Candidatus Peregrinibacteria bacterium]
MTFLKAAKLFLGLSVLLVVIGIGLLFVPGPKLSIEFTGGTLMELKLPQGKTKEDLVALLEKSGIPPLAAASMTETKTESYYVRSTTLTNEEHLQFLATAEKEMPEITELQFTTIGPTVGATLKRRAVMALLIATIAIVVYIAFAFRKIPRKMSPLRFGIIAVVALLHDIIITMGIFVILSHTTTFQVDTLFISALLSIMGYSVNDTIVIFDRIRDNLSLQGSHEDFATLATRSLQQTLTRTINTGFGALIMLFALFFLGSESIRWFILTLIIGTIIGTYSSFFVATPLLIFWKKKS